MTWAGKNTTCGRITKGLPEIKNYQRDCPAIKNYQKVKTMVLEIANCRKHGWETMDILGRSKSWGTKNGRKGWFLRLMLSAVGDQNRCLGPGNTPCRTNKARHLRAYPHLVIEYNLTWKPIFVFENVDLLLPNQHSPPHRPISSFERKYSAFFASGTTIAPPPFSYQNVMYLFL